MPDNLKSGDTVRLKSGGPLMTVTTVGDNMGTPTAWCVWFEGSKRVTGYFPVAGLNAEDPPGEVSPFA